MRSEYIPTLIKLGFRCSISHSRECRMRRDTWWVLVAGDGLESHPHEQPTRVIVAIAPAVRGGVSPARPPQRSPARRCKWRVAAGIVAAVV